jgi:hypothetical protein
MSKTLRSVVEGHVILRAGEKEEVKKFVDNIWPPCPDTCPSRKGGECNSQLTRDALTFDLIEFVATPWGVWYDSKCARPS